MKWVKNCLTDRSLKTIVDAELWPKKSVTRVSSYAIRQWSESKYKTTPDDICRWHCGHWNSKEWESRKAWRSKHRLAWANKCVLKHQNASCIPRTKNWTSLALLALRWTLTSESAVSLGLNFRGCLWVSQPHFKTYGDKIGEGIEKSNKKILGEKGKKLLDGKCWRTMFSHQK